MSKIRKVTDLIGATVISLVTISGCALVQLANGQSQEAISPDRGDLILSYQAPDNQAFENVYAILQETRFFDDLVADLNDTYSFPQDIDVTFVGCGEDNAFYDPENVEITMCYDLIQKYADIAIEEYQGDYSNEVILAGYFTFLHELGHALVDQYDLPIIVKEEDVVDSFAAILLLETGEEEAIIAGIEQFDIDAIEEEEFEELPFWGEHSLSIQRLYNLACLVYGSDPEAYSDFVEDDYLPEDRAESCPEEYEQAADGWETLLADFVKN